VRMLNKFANHFIPSMWHKKIVQPQSFLVEPT
jgi:hypothetical protein